LKYRYLDGQVISYNDCNSYTVSYDYLSAYPGKKTSIEVKNPAGTTIYSVNYTYDLAGNITEVNDTQAVDSNIALMTYDDNGRLSELKYWLSGNVGGPNVAALYAYNPDNRLTDIELAGGPVYMGRLRIADESIVAADGNVVDRLLIYNYDMLSQLIDANISNIADSNWIASYDYKVTGDMNSRTINGSTETFTYNGYLMTSADGNSLTWDKNGNLVNDVDANFVYNYDNRLKSAVTDGNTVTIKYDPFGNRILRQVSDGVTTTRRKYMIITISRQAMSMPVQHHYANTSMSNLLTCTFISSTGWAVYVWL